MKRQTSDHFETTINRWYIDTRPYVPQPHNPGSLHTLPLLSTLQHADQEAVTRFIRPADRFMSLASALLKYTFIHRRAKIPWSEVQISRTPAPHRRPYWEPPSDWSTTDIYDEGDPGNDNPCQIRGLEYNVSHQAGLVTIIGCSTPTAQPPSVIPNPDPGTPIEVDSFAQLDLNGHTCSAFDDENIIRLGVDIACTNEDKRTPKHMTTQSKFDEWVEIFAEMFSDRERRHMRESPIHIPVKERQEGDWSDSNPSSASSSPRDSNGAVNTMRDHEAKMIGMKLRRFYAYWGLKEAYIKMVGEGLLAGWLRELEFMDVHAPPPPPPAKQQQQTGGLSTLSNGWSRNSNGTQTVPENRTMPPPPLADTYADKKSPSGSHIPLPVVEELSAVVDQTDEEYAKQKVSATITPINTNAVTTHRRTSSIPAADMYAQRRTSLSSSTPDSTAAGQPSKPSFPGSSPNHGAGHFYQGYLSPFGESSSMPPLLEAPNPLSPAEGHHPEPIETGKWTAPDQAERGTTTLFKGRRVEDVKIELVAFDEDFIIATAIRGVKERKIPEEVGTVGEGSGWWLRLDFEKDIRPCAEGWCTCLDQ